MLVLIQEKQINIVENKIVERCGLRKFLGEDCDKTTYYTNIGRLDISNYDYKNSLV